MSSPKPASATACARRINFPPRASGEGGPSEARGASVGWWEGRGPQRSFGDDNEAMSQTPPPPPSGWSPSPALRGRISDPVLATRLRIRALLTISKNPPLKEGRRSADRRIQSDCRARTEHGRGPFSLPPPLAGEDLRRGPARLSALHRGIRRSFDPSARPGPRFLEPPDANGRTLSGTSAASTSQSGRCRTG